MKFDINTLKRATCVVMTACVLLLGTTMLSQAQRRDRTRNAPQVYYGPPVRNPQNIYRRDARQDLQRHQKYERLIIRDRWARGQVVGNRDWRERRKFERKAFKLHQRAEKQAFKQTWKNRRRGH